MEWYWITFYVFCYLFTGFFLGFFGQIFLTEKKVFKVEDIDSEVIFAACFLWPFGIVFGIIATPFIIVEYLQKKYSEKVLYKREDK